MYASKSRTAWYMSLLSISAMSDGVYGDDFPLFLELDIVEDDQKSAGDVGGDEEPWMSSCEVEGWLASLLAQDGACTSKVQCNVDISHDGDM